MPENSPNLNIPLPLGNENVTRAAHRAELEAIDQNAAKASDVAAHLAETMPHKFVDGATTYRWGLSVVGGVVMFNYEEVV